ncbi:MAG: hypothetical protein MK135_11645 [Polyangiaceae bacterium]|nr:hypothetical protein [Polyangiaceae bacterium]
MFGFHFPLILRASAVSFCVVNVGVCAIAAEVEGSGSSSSSASPSTEDGQTTEASPSMEDGQTTEKSDEELAFAPLSPDSQRPGPVAVDDSPFPPNRWLDVGGFMGLVVRPSKKSGIEFGPGIAYGAYLRPEITSWLGARLYYRQESLTVSVEPGAFDWEGDSYDFEWEQPNLKVVSLGLNLEPTLVLRPRLRAYGILGLGWVRYRAATPEAEGQDFGKFYRSAVEIDLNLGLGASWDIVPNWLNVSLSASYGFPFSQSGDAYSAQQIIIDGQASMIAPLPETKGAADVLLSLALIL